ncbi:uncharacterized protein LOC114155468 [Xiphophorus couchianus]|uniref:uncharacterized protein LOC114155468 n=1 Tax=Xiphophorus couchianus TaxID=32473 RepID=UPI0010172185|nr:uncharacterized protein LOC114155468 [Xiphophorus couchianus]
MKILVILVLVFLTGCNGGQYDHPSRCQVKMAQDAYWDYVQKSTLTPKDYVWDIRHSHPGQYLCSLISHSVETVQKFFRLVYTHIVMWSTHFYHRFCQEVDHLQQHLHDFLHHLEYDIHFHAKELVAQIRWQLEGIKILAGHYIEALDPRGLKMALLEKLKELNEHLKRCFELLETHHHAHHCDHHQHYDHKPPGHHHGHHHGQHPGHHHGQHPGHHHGHHHGQHPGHHHGQHPGHHPGHHHGQHPGHHPGHHHGQHPGHHPGHHHCHHHGHKPHGHHLGHHPGHHHCHHHGHKPPGHHHPPGHRVHGCGPEMKKKIDESMKAFKTTLFSLVRKFEMELVQTTAKINKKMVPQGKKPHGQLIKDSDHLKDDLESLWRDWILLSQQKVD